MALSVIYGSSLSQKSDLLQDIIIRESIAHPELQYIMVIPEQGSLTVQREMMLRHPSHALSNIDILSFQRLAYRVFSDLNLPMKNILNDTGKRMLLRLVVEKTEEELTIFKRNAGKPGFLDQLKSMLSELTQYNVTVENMQKNVNKLERYPLLCGKLKDLSTIYACFLEMLHENHMAAEELMSRLAQVYSQWEWAPKTVIVFDDYTGFTPLQYQVVEQILCNAPQTYLGAVMGQGHALDEVLPEDSLFSMTKTMVSHVQELAISHGIEIVHRRAEERQDFVPEIAHLEKNLFLYPKKKYSGEVEHLSLCHADSPSQEVAGALNEVLQGVREGIRYSEMAVICGDPDGYARLIEEQFSQAKIPFFFDQNSSLSGNVLVHLLQDVLRLLEQNFDFDTMFSYLKNPLLAYDYEMIGALENYALALGVRGETMWKHPFTRKYRGFSGVTLPALNEFREQIMEPLFSLKEALTKQKGDQGGEPSVRQRLCALVEFLERFHVYEIMEEEKQNFSQNGDAVMAREYEKAYPALMQLFTSMEELLGTQCLSLETFDEVLESGMEDLKIGIAPPSLDCLVIGDLTRTRLGHLKRLIVLGANEGVLPPVKQEGGLLSDSDRELLKEDLELAPTAREESFFQRFYLYLLFTKPTQRLSIYYSGAGNDGKTILPSFMVAQVKGLFPKLVETSFDTMNLKNANTPQHGLELLAGSMSESLKLLGEEEEIPLWWTPLYHWYASHPEYGQSLKQMEQALRMSYTEEFLTPEMAKKLFGDPAVSSTTRLEQYAGCAYAHFLRFGLGLEPRQEYGLKAMDFGNLFHESIEEFFHLLKVEGKDWNTLSDEERTAYVTASVNQVTTQYGNDILEDSARNRYMIQRILRMTDRTLWALTKQWKQGLYTKTSSEVDFKAGEDAPDLCLPIGQGVVMALQGRIDRMDWSEGEDKVYVKIIDYKSGNTELDYTRIQHGLQLQLLLYLEAAKALTKEQFADKEVVPAGVYYYHIDDPLIEVEDMEHPEGIDEALYQKLRLSGISNSDRESLHRIDTGSDKKSTVVNKLERDENGMPSGRSQVADTKEMNGMGDFVRTKAQNLGKDMISGKIPVNPYEYGQKSACDYCELSGICGFDIKLPGYRKKTLQKVEKEDLNHGN